MNWIFEDSQEIPANKDSKISFDVTAVKRAITKIEIGIRSGRHDLKKRLMRSSQKPPYNIIEYGENEALDMDYAKLIMVNSKHPMQVNFGVIFFDDTPQTDKEGKAVINPGLVFKQRKNSINPIDNDILLYISGHAIDRYCERLLKKPGYEMTDEELIQIYIDFNKMVATKDTITGELSACFDTGLFKGYADEDGNMFFKTFLATSNLSPLQSMKKKELNDIVNDANEIEDKYKALPPAERQIMMNHHMRAVLKNAIEKGVREGLEQVYGKPLD